MLFEQLTLQIKLAKHKDMLRSSSSRKKSSRIDQQLHELSIRKKDLKAKLRSIDIKDDYKRLQRTQNRFSHKNEEIENEIKQAKVALAKLENKIADLDNQKANSVIQLESMEIQAQAIQKTAINVFTPTTSQIDELQLKLIQIEGSEELADLTHLFSLRKVLLGFIKQHKIKPTSSINMFICQNGLLQAFKEFLMQKLESSKLDQFKMVIIKPIQEYISVMDEISSLIKDSKPEIKKTAFDEEEAAKTMTSLHEKERQIQKMSENVRKTNKKLQDTRFKIQKYKQYIEDLQKQQNQLKEEQDKIQQQLRQCQQNMGTQSELRKQIRQLNEAIQYLQEKKLESQITSNFSKSLIVIDQPEFSFLGNKQNCEHQINNYPKTSTKTYTYQSPSKYCLSSKNNKIKMQSPAWK